MKKSTMNTILSLIATIDTPEAETVRQELSAELSRGEAKATANRNAYAEYHDKVIQALSIADNAVTAQELADETGIARGKIVYGLTNYWAQEVVKDTTGKSTTYRLA